MWFVQSHFFKSVIEKSIGHENQLMHVVKRYMGRKSGSRVIEFPRRAPSKKQLKRRAKLMVRLGQKRDPKKEAIRDKKVLRQLDNPKLGDELKAMLEQMRPEVLELSKPNPNLVYPQLEGPPAPLPEFTIDGIEMLEHFEKFGKLQQGFKDTRIEIENENASPSKKLAARMDKELITIVNGTSLTTTDLEREANNYVQCKLELFFRTMNSWFPRKEVPPEYSAVYKIFYNLQKYNLRIDMETYCNIIRFQSFYGRYQSADQYFDEAIALCPAEDVNSTMMLWSAKIENLGRSGQINEAIATLDRLQKMFQTTNAVLYNPFLRVLVDGKHNDESDEFWLRMHTDGVDLNVESFNIYLKGLAFRGEVERAFFVFREMVVCNVAPNTESFCMLLHACSRGPWWVKGYEDMVYDALDLIEASEFAPNRKIYNAIINVFAQSGDAMAAEYYFWEMRRKGIRPDSSTYTVLLEAYSRAQSVGVKYGYKGRYAPPPPKPFTEDEMAMRELGPKRTAAIFASGIHAEPVQPGRGTKNEKKLMKIIDLYDNEEDRESSLEKIRLEAAELREKRRSVVAKHLFQKSSEESTNDSASLESGFVSPQATVSSEEDKVRITFDDPKMLENALSKAGGKLDNIRVQGLLRNEEDDTEENEDDEEVSDKNQVSDDNEELLEKADEYLDENLPTSQYRKQQEQHRRVWQKIKGFTFSDPFREEKGLKGQLWAEHRKRMRILKNKEQKRIKSGQRTDSQKDPESSSIEALLDNEADEAGRVNQQVSILSALDKKEVVQKDLDMMRKEIDKDWDFRSFGKAPPQDYEIGLVHKQNIIKSRAMLAFENMIENRIEPNVSHWNRLLAVHSEAMRTDEAVIVFRNIKKDKELVDSKTYEYMIRMYIRIGDMENAVMMKDEAIAGGFIPTEESFGLLLRGFTHRGKIVEALKILEESRSKGVAIRERNIKHLRSRCQSLGVSHPDLPPDPNDWVKSLKKERRNVKLSHQRRIQPLISKSFR